MIILNEFSDQHILCPVCKTWIKAGAQPNDGEIQITKENHYLPGQPTCIIFGNPTPIITINYKFKDETDNIEGLKWEEFLPLTREGIKIAKMLKVAFDRKLLFSVEYSDTKKIVKTINMYCLCHSFASNDDNMECAANNYPNCPKHLEHYEMYFRALGVMNEDL